ncbi:MAG: DUF4139 domain-containing protein [Nitrospiria bacterium]
MKPKRKQIVKLSALILTAAFLIFFKSSMGSPITPQPEEVHEKSSGLDDQETVSVTVYNSNIGLVRETRRIDLEKGLTGLKFTDVAARIIPQTVHIRSLTDPSRLHVLEQNYEYDLLTPQKLLDKFVGKELNILYGDAEISITLLSTQNGIVYRQGDRVFTGHPGKIIFPKLPENLIPNPTLVWQLENRSPRPHRVESTYLTEGMSWKADYVALLDKEDRHIDLTGWVTLDNRSGATYKNARLKLVAGDVNRVFETFKAKDDVRMRREMSSVAKPSAFREESFFEYHLYTLQRPTTLKENQTKQVTLLTANQVPVTKHFLYYGAQHYYRTQYGVPISNQKVGVYIEIANKMQNRLGISLPKGTVRVYKADGDGGQQFIGEDRIDHTPKDETIKIKMGEAFDIVAERKQTAWRKLSHDTYEVAFEVTLRNHKASHVTVNVIEPIPGDWEILHSSHDFQKLEAHTLQFDIPVKKEGKAVLEYRVRIRL